MIISCHIIMQAVKRDSWAFRPDLHERATRGQEATRTPIYLCCEFTIPLHKIGQILVYDAVTFLNEVATSQDELRIVVAYLLQWRILPVFGLFGSRDSHCDLGIGIVCIALPEDEIAFKRPYSTDTHRIAMDTGIYVDDVLKGRTVVDSVVCVGCEVNAKIR